MRSKILDLFQDMCMCFLFFSFFLFIFPFVGDSARPCIGCGSQIHDQYILRVAPNLEWHAACLKCSECKKFLDENCTCFVRNGKIFCKEDYLRYLKFYFKQIFKHFWYTCNGTGTRQDH